MGGPQCRMSILRNDNVACLCRLFPQKSHIGFQKRLCPVSLYFYPHVGGHSALYRMSNLRFAEVASSVLGVRGHHTLWVQSVTCEPPCSEAMSCITSLIQCGTHISPKHVTQSLILIGSRLRHSPHERHVTTDPTMHR